MILIKNLTGGISTETLPASHDSISEFNSRKARKSGLPSVTKND